MTTHRTTMDAGPTPARRDIPFYDDEPMSVSGRQWAALLAAVVAAGALDLVLTTPGPAWLALLVRGTLFAAIPGLAFTIVLPGHWRSILGRIRATDVRTMLAVWIANLVVVPLVAVVVSQLTPTQANPANDQLADLGAGGRLLFLASMVPQLVGEELVTVLLLVATMSLATRHLHLSRGRALLVGVAVSTIAFAALHLPTYDWNVVQCLAVIGTARVVLLVAFLRTKNIATSTAAHVLNDWTLFSAALLH